MASKQVIILKNDGIFAVTMKSVDPVILLPVVLASYIW